jgi:plastocyanin
MKKRFRRISVIAGALALTASILFSNFTGTVFVSKAAWDDNLIKASINANGLQSEYELSELHASNKIPLPKENGSDLTRTLKNSAGTDLTNSISNDEFLPTYADWYTVDFTASTGQTINTKTYNGFTRSFTFRVKANDYTIEVAGNGAAIPSFVKSGEGFVLPRAAAVYTGARGKIIEDTAQSNEIKITVEGPGFTSTTINNSGTDTERTVTTTADSSGKYSVRYYLATAGVTVHKDFSVTADKTFEKGTSAPVLNVSGVPSSGALYTKLTLPTASATDPDGKDTNVGVTVSVKAPDNTETMYTLDEFSAAGVRQVDADSGYILDGFKTASDTANYYAKAANAVAFDNNRNMTFYPHFLADNAANGTYVVTYTATTDSGATSSYTYDITVSRAQRPKITVEASEIPAKWAIDTLITADPESTAGGTLTYTYGEDNATKDDNTSTTSADNLNANNVAFDLYIPFLDDKSVIANAVPVSAFRSVKAEYKSPNADTYTEIPNDTGTVTKSNDFGEDVKYWVIKAATLKAGGYGDWEIRYTADTGTSEYSTTVTSYSVTVTGKIEDTKAPEVIADNLQAGVRLGGTLTNPTIKTSDNTGVTSSESRYYVVATGDISDGKVTTLNNAREFGKDRFYNGKIEKLSAAVLGITPNTELVATDSIVIRTVARDAAGNVTTDDRIIKIIDTSGSTAPTITAIKDGPGSSTEIAPDDTYNFVTATGTWFALGEIIATTTAADDYLGFEIAVKKPDGKGFVEETETTFYTDKYVRDTTAYSGGEARVLHITGFKFRISSGGVYTVSINVFDAAGNTTTAAFHVVASSRAGAAEAGIPSAATPGTPINLPEKVVTFTKPDGDTFKPEELDTGSGGTDENKYADYGYDSWKWNSNANTFDYTTYIYRTTIKGGRFSIAGRELTTLSEGEYTVIMQPDSENAHDADKEWMPAPYYGVIKSESAVNPTLSVQGLVPTVSENKYDTIVIPAAVASDASGIDSVGNTVAGEKVVNGVRVSVTGPSSPSLDYTNSVLSFGDNTNGLKEGKYTVTYKAVNKLGKEVSQTYTIDVGDVYAPEVTLNPSSNKYTAYPTDMKVGDKFTFIPAKATDKTVTVTNNKPTNNGGAVTTTDADVTGSITVKLKLNGEEKFAPSSSGGSAASIGTGGEYTFAEPGTYTVEYTVKDAAGNEGVKTFTIKVTDKTAGKLISDKALAAIFTVLGVVLIGGAVFYFIGIRRKNTRLGK